MMNHASCCKSLALMPCLLLLILLAAANARAQGGADVSKLEVGVQFSSLNINPPDLFGIASLGATVAEAQVEPGFGGRITYNLNSHFALEAEGNFFPHRNVPEFLTGGRLLQAQAGLKAGKRFGKFGLFAKARPGLVSFSELFKLIPSGDFSFLLERHRKTYFSMDVGGVVEFYPSRRIVTRFDAGDTIIRYGKVSLLFPGGPPQVRTKIHNFQLSAGVGFRFFGPASSESKEEAGDAGPKKSTRKFELGAQFTSLTFRTDFFFGTFDGSPPSVRRITHTEPGFGGRLTYNLNDRLAVEAEGNFLPRDTDFVAVERGSGRVTQGQFGVKLGKRFKSFGLFGKARPGFVSFGRMAEFLGFNSTPFSTSGPFIYRIRRKTYFSTDVGGVFEFYPSRRILTRFDAGDTMIRYDRQTVPSFNSPFTRTDHVPAQTSHNLQFSAGVGFRF